MIIIDFGIESLCLIQVGVKIHQNTVMSDRQSAVSAREPSAEENSVNVAERTN